MISVRIQLLYVPNAPCGVESDEALDHASERGSVPNAPCGVESPRFKLEKPPVLEAVPNAPCGVERS